MNDGEDSLQRVEAVALPAEVEMGNHEYKFQLANTPRDRVHRLISQMKWRLAEGNGEAKYSIGVEDDGRPTGISMQDLKKSIETLKYMAGKLHCQIAAVEVLPGLEPNSRTALVTIRANPAETIPTETRVVVLGESGSGKTTLISVLKSDEPDDGNGLARQQVLQHQHELDQGLTSSTSYHTLWYDHDGEADLDFENGGGVPVGIYTDQRNASCSKKVQQYSRLVSLVDGAGHLRFIKSALHGLIALEPNYAIIVLDASALLDSTSTLAQDMRIRLPVTLNMIHICSIMRLPYCVVVSKCDSVEIEQLKNFRVKVSSLLRAASQEMVVHGESFDNSVDRSQEVPIFTVSCVTLDGLDNLRKYLYTVEPDKVSKAGGKEPDSSSVTMFVREAFYVSGFNGAILGGIPRLGPVRVGQEMWLGPDVKGNFKLVSIESIRTAYGLNVNSIESGHTATFGVKITEKGMTNSAGKDAGVGDSESNVQDDMSNQVDIFKQFVRRGSVLGGSRTIPPSSSITVTFTIESCLSFAPENVSVLGPEFQLGETKSYHFVVRCSTVKQRAKLIKASSCMLTFEMISRPEIFLVGSTAILQHCSLILVCTTIETGYSD